MRIGAEGSLQRKKSHRKYNDSREFSSPGQGNSKEVMSEKFWQQPEMNRKDKNKYLKMASPPVIRLQNKWGCSQGHSHYFMSYVVTAGTPQKWDISLLNHYIFIMIKSNQTVMVSVKYPAWQDLDSLRSRAKPLSMPVEGLIDTGRAILTVL